MKVHEPPSPQKLFNNLRYADFKAMLSYAFLTFNSLHSFRAANNGRSTDNVRSKLGIDRTNPWIAGHLVRSFTDSFREILIFNYLIITMDNIHVSERKTKTNMKLDKLEV